MVDFSKHTHAGYNWCVVTTAPDGENYFQGIHEVPPGHPLAGAKLNLWTIVFDDLKERTGIFTHEQAELYHKLIGLDGVRIENYWKLKRELDKQKFN